MTKLTLTIFVFIWATAGLATTDRVYLSPMEESSWVLSTDSVLRCEMEHAIPGFGKAVFYQESGGRRLNLKFISDRRYKKDIDIAFRSVSASWKGVQTVADLARLKSSGTRSLVSISNDTASYAYFELQQGYQPSLYFVVNEFGPQTIAVVLSTVNFGRTDEPFRACLTRLYADHFDDVQLARVEFDFDEEFPAVAEEEKALKRLLNYVAVDSAINSISVIGHTDYKGSSCYNQTLSERRAWYIYDYLVQSGIESKKLRIEFKGESEPLLKGKDDNSRARNRRVEVRLHK